MRPSFKRGGLLLIVDISKHDGKGCKCPIIMHKRETDYESDLLVGMQSHITCEKSLVTFRQRKTTTTGICGLYEIQHSSEKRVLRLNSSSATY